MRRHEQCRHLRAHAHEAAMPILRRPRDRHRDIRARPARRPGRGCHNLEPPLTGLQRRRRSAPSAAGSLRAAEVSDLRRTARNTGILSPSTAASQTARASRALATSRRITTRSPNAFTRPKPTRRNRQIPIDPEAAIFIPRVLSLEAFGHWPQYI